VSGPGTPLWATGAWRPFTTPDRRILFLSIALQLALAVLFGHSQDTRIFMAAGYQVGTGHNPYVAQDLTAVFHHFGFGAMTSIGYPPPWPLILGLLYRASYALVPCLLAYNLAIKIPIMAANIGLAYLVAGVLRNRGAGERTQFTAWAFLLFNPLLLYFGAAWGQIDPIVALLALAALVLLYARRGDISAVLLALAVCFKPIAAPIVLVALVYLAGRSPWRALRYAAVFGVGVFLFYVAPFLVLGWDLGPAFGRWNAQLSMTGSMALTTFVGAIAGPLRRGGDWWLLGLLWIPAVVVAVVTLRRGIGDFEDLLRKSTGLVLVFFLTRAKLAEPNVILVMVLVLLLTSLGELERRALTAVWVIPLAFTVFNLSAVRLLFVTFPGAMEKTLTALAPFGDVARIGQAVFVIAWQVAGWWIVVRCFGKRRAAATEPGGLATWN
jgi:hypothetical protein